MSAHIFPSNYMWSLAAMIALNSGGAPGEVLGLCNSDALQKASIAGDDGVWVRAWTGLAQRVEHLAIGEAAAGHQLSAGQSYLRAAVYLQVAERLLDHDHPARIELFVKSQRLFREFCARRREPIEVVSFPYGDETLEAYLLPATSTGAVANVGPGRAERAPAGRVPCVVFLDGLDATAETMAVRALPLTERGIACMVVDGPGWGAALRLKGLTTRYDYEVVAAAAVDHLEARPDIDEKRLGIMAISLGGYYAPRVAAFERRFSAGAAWGAIWDYPSVLQRRLEQGWTASSSVSAPRDQAAWVFGVGSLAEAVQAAQGFRLDGVAQQVTCPFLVVHGEADKQIPLADAQALYDALGSQDKQLRVFTTEETGAEHCQWDNIIMAQHYIFDWFADQFQVASASNDRIASRR